MADHLDEYRMVGYGNNFLTVRSIGEKVLDRDGEIVRKPDGEYAWHYL